MRREEGEHEVHIGLRRTHERNRRRRKRRDRWDRRTLTTIQSGIAALAGDPKAAAKVVLAVVAIGVVFWAMGTAAWETIRFGNPVGPTTSVPADADEDRGRSESRSSAEALATLDRQAPTNESGLIQRYENLLEGVSVKCVQPEDRVAEIASAGVEEMEQRRGVAVDRYEMLHLIDRAIPPDGAPIDCSGVVAFIVTSTVPQ